jgi:hypothetical protein
MKAFRLAIIGAGPYGTYAMERLYATAAARPGRPPLEIHVYERTGEFGAGQVHSARQAPTSYLNRTAGELSFAADETVEDAGPLLPQGERPTLHEWCRRRFAETGDPRFDLAPGTYPRRYLHGLALQEAFTRYVDGLRRLPAVSVHLHPEEVTDLADRGERLRVTTSGGAGDGVEVHHALVVTGHGYPDPDRYPARRDWAAMARAAGVGYLPSVYPLDARLPAGTAAPEEVVGCAGTMLTGIDVVLHLTEGRGGRFRPDRGGGLRYLPSGREPGRIVMFSESGLFCFARAVPSGPAKHRGMFLTTGAVDRLRALHGVPAPAGAGKRRQLDYQRHLFPLVLLEMTVLYYTTLLGEEFGRHLAGAVTPAYEKFLAEGGTGGPPGIATATVASCVDQAAHAIDGLLTGAPAGSAREKELPWPLAQALHRYVSVVFGPEVAGGLATLGPEPAAVAAFLRGQEPRWRHHRLLSRNRFSWAETVQPVRASSPAAYQRALLEFMLTDNLWARQGIPANPAKSAADGVWRGLRPVIVYAVNDGGLTAHSHRWFLQTWLRHHNRLAYGAAPEVMDKLVALLRHGVVDASTGPGARLAVRDGRLLVLGPATGAAHRIDRLVDARVHQFNARADASPLYPNLLRRGLARQWHNPDAGGGFAPGGLDLTDDFHPVRADGSADLRLTFLGPSIEGRRFFQGGAMKPHANHHAMRNILTWLREFWRQALAAS